MSKLTEVQYQARKQFEHKNRSRKAEKAKMRKVYKKRGQKHNFVESVANRLQGSTPKSEIWFKQFLIDSNLDNLFLQNVPLNSMIPDFINLDHRVVIEIDGAVHDNPAQIQRDNRKNKEYKRLGYTLFRVRHLDESQALSTIKSIQDLI